MGAPPPDDTRTDQQLVADLNAGDATAFDALYHRYKNWVLSLATRMTGDGDLALDVLQETYPRPFRDQPHLSNHFRRPDLTRLLPETAPAVGPHPHRLPRR